MPNSETINPAIIDELGGIDAGVGINSETHIATLDDNIIIDNDEGTTTHSQTNYQVKDFVPEKVSGISVGVVTATVNSTEKAFGTGLCRKIAPDKYELIVNGKSFLYNSKGEGISSNSVGTKLKLGETTPTQLNTIRALSARDEFAMHILGELLRGVSDPSILGTTEMAYYTKLAYTWSAYMMDAAADGRDADTNMSEPEYNSNTEALLGQIAEAISESGSGGNNGDVTVKNYTGTTLAVSGTISASGSITTSGNTVISGTHTANIGSSGLGNSAQNPFYVSVDNGITPTQSDWNQSDPSALSYIKNKPTNIALLGDAQGSSTIANFDPQTDTVHLSAQTLSSSTQEQVRTNISAVGSSDVTNIVKMTQAAYNLITPNNNTLYIIVSS